MCLTVAVAVETDEGDAAHQTFNGSHLLLCHQPPLLSYIIRVVSV